VFSLTASFVPCALGAALAMEYQGQVKWVLLPLIVISAMSFHIATNLINDYFDFKNGVDKDCSFGSSRVLVEGKLTPKQVYFAGILFFAFGCLIGIVFIIYRGWPIFVLGFSGMLAGYFYTAKPVGFKYLALGDIGVFWLMGPLMVIGSFYVLTGQYNNNVLLVSLPIGFMVTSILYANNLRDIDYDLQANVRTAANLLGFSRAVYVYYLLVSMAYLITVTLVFCGLLTLWSLLVLATVPLALKNFMIVSANKQGPPEKLKGLDVQTAKLHLAFGMFLILSILFGGL